MYKIKYNLTVETPYSTLHTKYRLQKKPYMLVTACQKWIIQTPQ